MQGRSSTTCAAQFVTLVSTIVDTITGSLLRNVFPIHTVKGVIRWRSCKLGILSVKFIYRVVGDILIPFGIMRTVR